MGKVVRIPAGNTTNVHYNFVVAKPLVHIKIVSIFNVKYILDKPLIYYQPFRTVHFSQINEA